MAPRVQTSRTLASIRAGLRALILLGGATIVPAVTLTGPLADPIAHRDTLSPRGASTPAALAQATESVPADPVEVIDRAPAEALWAPIEGPGGNENLLAGEPIQPARAAPDPNLVAGPSGAILDQATAIGFGERTFPVDRAALRQALRSTGSGAAAAIDFDPVGLRPIVSRVAAEIDRPVRPATVTLRGGRVDLDPGQPGLAVQIDDSTAALGAGWLNGEAAPQLVVAEIAPPIEFAPAPAGHDYAAVRHELMAILSAPVVVKVREQEWTLAPADVAALLSVSQARDGTPAAIAFDEPALEALVQEWASRVDQPAVSPKLAWQDGQVTILREGRRGFAVKRSEATAALAQAMRSDQRVVHLPVAERGRDLTQATLSRLGIKERVVAAQTSYAGSIPENAYNLELAAERLNGTVVAPGEQFSFNRAMGPASLAAGFRWGYGVFDTGAGVETAPSVAGGICQVPTTLFQAVFRAGYPIDERHPHSYWIPRYGPEGLDAAVDEETHLDFRFTNETPDYLLIQSWTQDETLHVELFGTKPDWQTEIREPVIRGRVVATQRLVREPVEWLPAGETRQVEQAADGFTVTITRIVTREGKPRQGSFTSRYKPARNVVLIGTGRRGG